MHETSGGSASEEARDFYQALHRAFGQTLHKHQGRLDLVEALMSQAFDSFDGNVAIQAEPEPALDCRRGCASCCTLRVSATAPEVWLIARFLRAIAPGLEQRGIDLITRLKSIDEKTRGLSEAQRVNLKQVCPFIAQGVCIIYAVRPLACRGHASHDVKACVEAAAGRSQLVPYSVAYRTVRSLVQHAMQSALRDAGLPWFVYELNHALVLALKDNPLQAQWLTGHDTLSPAALPEVSPRDLAAIYDQLRPDM